jgi:5-methylthioadenosine/S-adenosylhomocysteine deaminase
VHPIRYLDELGILEARPLLAHVVHADAQDAELLARGGASVAHCPKSNAKFGHGIAPLADFLAAGVAVGLGSDGMGSNDVMDPFEEMRAAVLFSRARGGDFAALGAADALALATLGGARALGLQDQVGSLEPGKRADLAAVSLDGPHLQPLTDVSAALVFAAHQTDVRFTMVHGRVLFDGERVTTTDEAEARRQVQALGRSLAAARRVGPSTPEATPPGAP